MNVRRRGHSCGSFVKDGETVIIVAGGFDHTLTDLDSVELLIPSSGKGWQFGKIFCFIEKIHLDIINFCRTKVTIQTCWISNGDLTKQQGGHFDWWV